MTFGHHHPSIVSFIPAATSTGTSAQRGFVFRRGRGECGRTCRAQVLRQVMHCHAPGKSRKQSGRGPAPAISRHGTAPAARRRQKPFCWRRCQGSRYNSSGSSASPYWREIGSMLTISHNKATGKNLIYALGSLMESKPCGFYSVSHLDGLIIIEQKVF